MRKDVKKNCQKCVPGGSQPCFGGWCKRFSVCSDLRSYLWGHGFSKHLEKWNTKRLTSAAGYVYMKMSGWAWDGDIDFRLHNANDDDKVFTSVRTISYNDKTKKEIASNVKKNVEFKIGARSEHQCGVNPVCYLDKRWDGTVTWNK